MSRKPLVKIVLHKDSVYRLNNLFPSNPYWFLIYCISDAELRIECKETCSEFFVIKDGVLREMSCGVFFTYTTLQMYQVLPVSAIIGNFADIE